MGILARHWWALVLRGVVAVLFGLLAFLWPGITLIVLVMLFGAYAVIDGLFAIGAAVRIHRLDGRWWGLLIEGILGVVVGIVTLVWPAITALVLLYLIAFWAIFTGILELIAAIHLRREIQGELLLGLGGMISIVFGLLLLLRPGTGALAVVWLIGAYALVFGVVLIWLGWRMRAWYRYFSTQGASLGLGI